MAFFDRLKSGLSKTKNAVIGQIDELLKSFVKIDEEMLEELEELLICADVGVATTLEILENLREMIKERRLTSADEARLALREIMREMLGDARTLSLEVTPAVLLVIGVNGVIVAAADTFRAAASEQLTVWCERAGVDIVKHETGADPAAVVFDAISAAKSRKADLLIIDTAGRLHNKKNLMDELAKINRVISRELPNSSRETLLVLDATTGQNAVIQAKEFKNAADITGLILTKLDGTAKGGIILSVKKELDIPVKFIGVGEQIDDMRQFDPDAFISAIFD